MFDPMPPVAPRLALGTALPAAATERAGGDVLTSPGLGKLCNRLAALESEVQAILATCRTIEDEKHAWPHISSLHEVQDDVVSAILDTPIRTIADATAVARAAYACAEKDADGTIETFGVAEWLSVYLVEALADPQFSPRRARK